MADNRTNLWTFIIYPEDSLPDNYLNIINNWHIPCLLSPIHNKDINGSEDEMKKHIHVMLYFGIGAKKSYDQVKIFSDQLNGCNPFPVISRRALTRYFIHKDDPEKQQFPDGQYHLTCLGGFDIGDSFSDSNSDEEYYQRIEDIIYKETIFNFASLVEYLRVHNFIFELQFLRTHTIYFNSLLNGHWQRLK